MTATTPGRDPVSHDVEVRGLVKAFGPERALDDVSFVVRAGSFFTLLGPSGCGKTTTLMCIAGLHRLDAGEVRVGGVLYTSVAGRVRVPPERRDIGMVFQSYAIWPHMTVTQNVAYPLEVRKVPRDEQQRRVADALRLVGLEAMADKLAIQLSGGQQQRTALARAIVFRPRLLLFDEPLSNLDLKLREQMRIELKRIQRQVGITSIYVTHDQAEALALSDEVAIMSKGRIVQMGPPAKIYGRPANSEVSRFMGVANVLPGRLVRITAPGRGEIEIGEDGARSCVPCQLGEGVEAGATAVLSVRPEHVAISAVPGGERCLEGEVLQISFLGSSIDCRVRCGTLEWRILTHPRERLRPGQRVYLRVSPEHSLAVRG